MARWNWIAAGLLLISFLVVFVLAAGQFRAKPLPASDPNQTSSPTPARGYVLLPESELNTYGQFYFFNPRERVGAWLPSESDIDDLEENLSQISHLKAWSRADSRHIENPDRYFRQYLGLTVSGKKLIFVNATCQFWREDPTEWRRQLQLIDDGGQCYWQAYYEPSTHKFSHLMINGTA